jgi:hypothetical protein
MLHYLMTGACEASSRKAEFKLIRIKKVLLVFTVHVLATSVDNRL